MEYVYAALLLHKAGTEISEDNIKKVLEAAGVKVDEARVKALVSALEGVNIDEIIEKAAMPAAAPVAQAVSGAEEKKKEEAPKEEKKSEEEAAAGLGALFG
ncbi:50S ribosomal protein P1 [Nanoarchaeota archaeon]|nr:MAG: 50S ribosomal protein P1 [Nanoarchaeota archaeon]